MPYFNDGSLVWHFKSSDRNKLERMNERGLSSGEASGHACHAGHE